MEAARTDSVLSDAAAHSELGKRGEAILGCAGKINTGNYYTNHRLLARKDLQESKHITYAV